MNQAAPKANASADRQEWLAERRKKIGASELSAIMGLNPYSTPWVIWAEKTGRLTKWEGNAATRAGQLFEPLLLDEAEKRLGELSRDVRYVCDDVPLAATCDGVTVADGVPVEAKTTGIVGRVVGQWGDEFTDDVPQNYALQVHAQMICTGAELGHLIALIAGRGICQFEIQRSEVMVDAIKTFVDRWWRKHIIGDFEPSAADADLSVVKRLRKTPDKTIDCRSPELVAAWEQRRAERLAAQKAEDAAQAELLASLADAEAMELPDGRRLTYFETTRNDKPRPAKTVTFRTLRIKGKANG